nr:ABC transporter ATP-binding protein [Bacteroidota bacterium]
MRKFFGVLRYVNGYWRYGILNITFNVLSVIFSLFSIAMLFPFLKVLFSNDPQQIAQIIAKGKPVFSLSTDGVIDSINYTMSVASLEYGKLNVLVAICLFIIVTIFLKNLCRYLGMYFLSPIRSGAVRDIRNKLFNKTLHLPLSYYSEERKGDIMSRMTTDVQEIEWS